MTKHINSICESCDSEFSLSFNKNLVKDYEQLRCPFCSQILEDLDEESSDKDNYDELKFEEDSESDWD